MAASEICEIFSTYYFSYAQSYKATLRGGQLGVIKYDSKIFCYLQIEGSILP